MSYLKKGKIWKNIDKKDLDLFWEICFDSYPEKFKKIEKKEDFLLFCKETKLVYPETDKRDGTAGITPKQLSYMLSIMDSENIKRMVSHMNENKNVYNAVLLRKQKIDTEEYNGDAYLWALIFKKAIKPRISKEKPEVSIGKLFLGSDVFRKAALDDDNNTTGINFHNEVYSAYFNRELTKEEVSKYVALRRELGIKSSEAVRLKDLSEKAIREEYGKDWMKEHGFIPKNKEMFTIDPIHWDKKVFLDSLNYFFGTKNLSEIDTSKDVDLIKKFILIYQIFGRHIEPIRNVIKEKKIIENSLLSQLEKLPKLYSIIKEENTAFDTIVKLANRGFVIEFTLENYITALTTTSFQASLRNFIVGRDKITYGELQDYVLSQEKNILKNLKEERLDLIKAYDFDINHLFKKYNVEEYQVPLIMKLYEKTKHLKTEIPLFKLEIGDLIVEMLDKNDIRGLVAGDATNCCQRVLEEERGDTPTGSNCVYYGAEELNSAFFIVSKGKNIVAQSWTWLIDETLCFDSIEFLGTEVSDKIIEGYELYAEHALKSSEKIKRVVAGNCSDEKFKERYEEAEKLTVHPLSYDSTTKQYIIDFKED